MEEKLRKELERKMLKEELPEETLLKREMPEKELTERDIADRYVLRTEGLTKIYGGHRAVNSVSMHVRKGDIYGFIGKNGA